MMSESDELTIMLPCQFSNSSDKWSIILYGEPAFSILSHAVLTSTYINLWEQLINKIRQTYTLAKNWRENDKIIMTSR